MSKDCQNCLHGRFRSLMQNLWDCDCGHCDGGWSWVEPYKHTDCPDWKPRGEKKLERAFSPLTLLRKIETTDTDEEALEHACEFLKKAEHISWDENICRRCKRNRWFSPGRSMREGCSSTCPVGGDDPKRKSCFSFAPQKDDQVSP